MSEVSAPSIIHGSDGDEPLRRSLRFRGYC